MKEPDPLLPDVLEACTVYLMRDRDAWSVCVDAVGVVARCIVISADYQVAARVAWEAAARWRAYLLLESTDGKAVCLSPDKVLEAVRRTPLNPGTTLRA